MTKLKILLFVVFFLFLALSSPLRAAKELTVNFSYLDGLIKTCELPNGEKITYWQEPKVLDDAPIVNLESISLIARAYLLKYHLGQTPKALDAARAALKDLLALQKPDGAFSQSFFPDGHADGTPSPEDKGKAYLALCQGIQAFAVKDPKFAVQLSESARKFMDPLIPGIKDKYKKFTTPARKDFPAWLPDDHSAFAAYLICGITELPKDYISSDTAEILPLLCEGIKTFQAGDRQTYPFCGFFTQPERSNVWLLEDAVQGRALAQAYDILKDPLMLSSALKEANGMELHLLASYGPIFGFSPHPMFYPQTPQGVQVMVENYLTLYRLTQEEHYAGLAGLAGSFLFGNNPVHQPLYNPQNGKVLGVILDEQTAAPAVLKDIASILITLQQLKGTPGENFLAFQENYSLSFQMIEAEDSKALYKESKVEDWYYPNGKQGKILALGRGDTFWSKFKIESEGDYLFYFNCLKYPPEAGPVSIMVRVDAGKIYQINFGGFYPEPEMVMEQLPAVINLVTGYHTFGLRFNGLLLSRPAILDSIVFQPVVEIRSFAAEGKKQLALFHNLGPDTKLSLPYPPGEGDIILTTFEERGRSADRKKVARREAGFEPTIDFIIPQGGALMMEWEGDKLQQSSNSNFRIKRGS